MKSEEELFHIEPGNQREDDKQGQMKNVQSIKLFSGGISFGSNEGTRNRTRSLSMS